MSDQNVEPEKSVSDLPRELGIQIFAALDILIHARDEKNDEEYKYLLQNNVGKMQDMLVPNLDTFPKDSEPEQEPQYLASLAMSLAEKYHEVNPMNTADLGYAIADERHVIRDENGEKVYVVQPNKMEVKEQNALAMSIGFDKAIGYLTRNGLMSEEELEEETKKLLEKSRSS